MKMMTTTAAAAAATITNDDDDNDNNNKQVFTVVWFILNRYRAADGREFKPPCQSTGRLGHHKPAMCHMW
jgi:hypothetical protein